MRIREVSMHKACNAMAQLTLSIVVSYTVYLILGQFHEHIGLMHSLFNRGLLDGGNEFVDRI